MIVRLGSEAMKTGVCGDNCVVSIGHGTTECPFLPHSEGAVPVGMALWGPKMHLQAGRKPSFRPPMVPHSNVTTTSHSFSHSSTRR